jgi:hypothetical protein
MGLDVRYEQKFYAERDHFTIDGNQEIENRIVDFEHDIVQFRFQAKPDGERIKCMVRLYELVSNDRGSELLGGYGELEIPENDRDYHYMQFSNFGYVDYASGERITGCWYKAWLDGYGGVNVEVMTE